MVLKLGRGNSSMKHSWSEPNKEWDGFRLTSYSLDSQKTLGLQLNQGRWLKTYNRANQASAR